jgi:hypothetical protein
MKVNVTSNATNYKLLSFAGNNNVLGSYQFDSNLITGKRLYIKRIRFKWYTLDNTEGLPYLSSGATIDGTVTGHDVLNSNSEKIFIPEESGSNIFQNSNCILNFLFNDKPVFLNGKMDNLFLNEDNLDLLINEPIQTIKIKVNNAKVCLLNGGSLQLSENIGWICELGAYIL